jgi:hypothetical protein
MAFEIESMALRNKLKFVPSGLILSTSTLLQHSGNY